MSHTRLLLVAAVLFALCIAAFAAVYSTDLLPSVTGYNLGSAAQRWNAFVQNINISGSCIYHGRPCFGSGFSYGSCSAGTYQTGNTTDGTPICSSLPNQPVDVGVTYNGTPGAIDLIRHPFPFGVVIPAGCPHTAMLAETAATGTNVFNLQHCAHDATCSTFGTVTFSASDIWGTVACAADTSIPEGDYIKLTATGTPDVAKIGGTAWGIRAGSASGTTAPILDTEPAYTVFGNATGSAAVPSFFRPASTLLSDSANLARLDAAAHFTGNVTIDGTFTLTNASFWQFDAVAFSGLTSISNGALGYCSDCDTPTSPGATCSSSGDKAGAEAHRIRGAWACY